MFLSFIAFAQPVPVIIQTGPGGLNHKYVLALEPALTHALGNQIQIEFKPGGQGVVGAKSLAEDRRSSMSLMIGAAQPEFALDQLTDIIPVIDLGVVPTVVIANPALGYNTLADIVKTPPTKPLTFGIPNGSAQLYWVREFAKNYPKIQFIEVPFKSGNEVLTNIVGGHIDIGIASAAGAAPLASNNKIIVLTTLSTQRSSLLSNISTPNEQGIKFAHDTTGFAHMFIWTNPGADRDTIEKFRREFVAWARTPESQELFKKIDLGFSIRNADRPEQSLRRLLKR
jgi:tripartite-type tricarboxylate transporter receptor subunit TctC